MKLSKKDISEIKLWVKALRSGKYKQGKGALQNRDGFCCLGVACKVLIPKGKLKYREGAYIYGGLPDEQGSSPKWLKRINNEVFLTFNISLVTLNDSDKFFSFDEIADLIQAVYLLKVLE